MGERIEWPAYTVVAVNSKVFISKEQPAWLVLVHTSFAAKILIGNS
jgi:hypothetical protein